MSDQGDLFGGNFQKIRERYWEQARKGTDCPCCDRYGQIYRRHLYSRPALTLVYTYPWFRNHPGEYLAVSKFCMRKYSFRSSENGKLVYFDMFEPRPGLRDDGSKRHGLYRITDLGVEFVLGRVKVQKTKVIYDDEIWSTEGPMIGIVEALGKKFDYHDLMSGV